jgi:hypothetical protein
MSVRSLLLLATLLFAGAAVLYPNIDFGGSLPRVHRPGTAGNDSIRFGWLSSFGGDVDCAGGGGNGPNFVYGPVVAPETHTVWTGMAMASAASPTEMST